MCAVAYDFLAGFWNQCLRSFTNNTLQFIPQDHDLVIVFFTSLETRNAVWNWESMSEEKTMV